MQGMILSTPPKGCQQNCNPPALRPDGGFFPFCRRLGFFLGKAPGHAGAETEKGQTIGRACVDIACAGARLERPYAGAAGVHRSQRRARMIVPRLFRAALIVLALAGLAFIYVFSATSAPGP